MISAFLRFWSNVQLLFIYHKSPFQNDNTVVDFTERTHSEDSKPAAICGLVQSLAVGLDC